MVKAAIRVVSLAAVALLPVFHLSAKNLNDYQLGDKLEEEYCRQPAKSPVSGPGRDLRR